jgi:hypothetical protein
MTDKKISELPAAAAIAGTEEIPVVQSAATVKSTPSAIKTYLNGAANTWTGVQQFGTIGGAVGKFVLAGSTSGSTIVNAAAVAGSTTMTFPGTTGTVAVSTVDNAFTAGQTITPAANTTALTVASHTQTASNPAARIAQTWNNAGVTFIGATNAFTSTASASDSVVEQWTVDGTTLFKIGKTAASAASPTLRFGAATDCGWFEPAANLWGFAQAGNENFRFGSRITCRGDNGEGGIQWSSSSSSNGTPDTNICRGSTANAVAFGPGQTGAGEATTRVQINKAVASIADATATTVFTVTVPNASHSAMVKVTLVGKIGAGGAIGAGEATGTISYDIAIARTAGVNAVATISTAYGSSTAAVAGATTITVAGDLGAVSGAVGASNTFTIRVTITKGGGSSANHTCLAYARLMNANATGITIA